MKKYFLFFFLFVCSSFHVFSQKGLRTGGFEFDSEPYTNIHPYVKGSLFFSENLSRRFSFSTGLRYRRNIGSYDLPVEDSVQNILPIKLHGPVVGQNYYQREFIIPFDIHYKFAVRNKWNASVFAGFSFNEIFFNVVTDKFSDGYEKWFFHGGRRGGFAEPYFFLNERIGFEFNHQFLKKYSVGLNVSTNPIDLLFYGNFRYSPLEFNLKLGRNFEPKANPKINSIPATPQKGDLTFGIFLQSMIRYHPLWFSYNTRRAIGGYAEKNLSTHFSLSLGIIFEANVNTETSYRYYWEGNPNWAHGYSYSNKTIDHELQIPFHVLFTVNPQSNYRLKVFAGINPACFLYITVREGYEDGYRSAFRHAELYPDGYDEFGFEVSHRFDAHYEISFGTSTSYLLYKFDQPWGVFSSRQPFNVPILFHLKLGKVIPKKNNFYLGPGRI